jgi:hypothetical protein
MEMALSDTVDVSRHITGCTPNFLRGRASRQLEEAEPNNTQEVGAAGAALIGFDCFETGVCRNPTTLQSGER